MESNKEKEKDYVTPYQQEVKIGKVYKYINDQFKLLDNRIDELHVLVHVLKTSLSAIEKNTEKMIKVTQENGKAIEKRFNENEKRVDDVEKKVDDRSKITSMWLTFIGVIAVPIISGLYQIAPYIFDK